MLNMFEMLYMFNMPTKACKALGGIWNFDDNCAIKIDAEKSQIDVEKSKTDAWKRKYNAK